jgi:poly(3-hydroxybutyrate) depolymerase
MKTFATRLTIICLFFFSCSSGNSGEMHSAAAQGSKTTPAYDNSLTAGKITDSIACQGHEDQSYALYLPSSYAADKKYPCIYFFDAHARGSLPLRKYKDIAERYGFVLIGSNSSKNGMQWQQTSRLVNVLMTDTRSRIHIDSQRIYLAGFSGGARVAGNVAMTAGGVAGVIGCAAGIMGSGRPVEHTFDYFGIVGKYDFNYGEMVQQDQAMQQQGFTHQLLAFAGKHDWPPAADFNTAVLWMQVNAIKEKRQSQNDSIVAAFNADFNKRITAAAGDPITQYDLLDGAVRTLGGWLAVVSFRKQLNELSAAVYYKKALALQEQLQRQEADSMSAFSSEFPEHDVAWWTAKITALRKSIKTANVARVGEMNQRLLAFLGLMGYMSSSHAIGNGDLQHAADYLKIFKLADPSNPDCPYLSAKYYMQKGDPAQAVASLHEAVALGYADVGELGAEPAFASLHDQAGFKEVMSGIQANRSK